MWHRGREPAGIPTSYAAGDVDGAGSVDAGDRGIAEQLVEGTAVRGRGR